ncbi:hypothetical protein GCM10023194_60560 [Planotetraspora phitsanulokensis]
MLMIPVLFALVMLSACGSDETGPPPAPVIDMPSIRPDPDSIAHAKYSEALNAIDPEIVGDMPVDEGLNRGRALCTAMKGSADYAELLELTRKQFTDPGHPNGFGPAKNMLILHAVRQYLCPAS